MTMLDKFKNYLEKEFRAIKPTKEAMEYREEVLATLLDHEQGLRDKGETDDEAIYAECISSLGDFASTLQDFENKRVDVKKAFLKASQIAMIAAGIMLVITAAYLALSIVTEAWSKTWLVEVGGAFAVVISLLCIMIPRQIAGKKMGFIRLEVAASLILLFVFAYLCVLMLIPSIVSKSWLIFFLMIVSVLLVDTILAYISGSKSAFVSLIALLPVSTALLYVAMGILGVAKGNYWGIYWILPMCGGIADFIILTVKYVFWYKKKQIKKNELDESYYTSWKE